MKHHQQHSTEGTYGGLKLHVETFKGDTSETKKGPFSNCSSDSLLLLPVLREVECVFNSFFLPPPSFSFGGVEEGQCLSVCVHVVVCLFVRVCLESILWAESPNDLIGV